MYQRKIKQWEIEKKHKSPEMRAIIRLARQRQAAGQDSVFRIRGRKTDIKEVYRYFRRRGEDPATLDVGDSPIPSTITIDTPSSSEISVSIARQHSIPYPSPATEYVPTSAADPSSNSSTGSDSVVSSPPGYPEEPLAWQLIQNDPYLPMPIDPTFDYNCSRYLLYCTQLFFNHIVPPTFYSQDGARQVVSKPWRRTRSTWSLATSEGHELLRRGQIDDTFKLRQKALDSVPKHITNRSPITLLRYFEIIHALCNSGDERDILFLDLTLKHVLAMAGMVLNDGHPIVRLTRLFLVPQAKPIIGQLAHQGISRSLDILFERCGNSHPRILYVMDSRTQALLDGQQYEAATKSALSYLERAEYIRGLDSYEACQARRMLGDAYAAQQQVDKASALYTRAVDLQKHLPSLRDRGVIGVRTLRGLARIARSPSEAYNHLQAALHMAIKAFGEEDAQVKLVLKDLDALQQPLQETQVKVIEEEEIPYRPLDFWPTTT